MEDVVEGFYKNKTVFVTGGSGFIGSNLVRGLLKNGASIKCLVRKNSELWRLKEILKDIELIEGDLENSDELFWKKSTKGADIIFHLGAEGVHFSSDINWKMLAATNIIGTMALISGSSMNSTVKKIISVGTANEYGNTGKTLLTIADALKPVDIYGATKACSTLMASALGTSFGVDVTVLRLFYVYGPYEMPPKLIPLIITKALTGEKAMLTKGGQIRDFTYVEDAVNAFLAAGCRGQSSQKVFNIGSGEVRSIIEVVKMIMELIPSNNGFDAGAVPYRPQEIFSLVPEVKEAQQYLNWTPAHTLEQGLKKTVEWFTNSGVLQGGHCPPKEA